MAVEPHKHCPICGTPIPLNELVCSPDCQKVWDARLLVIWAIMTFMK